MIFIRFIYIGTILRNGLGDRSSLCCGMSRIVIADICSISVANQSTGHYFAVAQNYLDIFKNSDEVWVAGGPIYNQRFASNLIQLPYNFVVGDSKWGEKWRELMNCRALCKMVAKDDILIMQSVALVTAFVGLALFLHKPCRLFFIQYNTESINSPLKKLLWKIVQSKVRGNICSFISVAQAYGKPYVIVPDYIYTQEQQMSFPSYDEREYDICMLGHIYRDKGVVDALQYLKGKGLKIVVAGKVGEPDLESELKIIAQTDKMIDLRMGYLKETEYHALMANSRYCMLNYRGKYNEHSSGVIYDALFHGTPVLATNTISTKMVKEYGLGISFDNLNNLDTRKFSDVNAYVTFQSQILLYLREQRKTIEQLSDFLHHI